MAALKKQIFAVFSRVASGTSLRQVCLWLLTPAHPKPLVFGGVGEGVILERKEKKIKDKRKRREEETVYLKASRHN